MPLIDPLPKALTQQLVKEPLGDLATFKSHPRPWHMPVVAAIAISLPVFIGASVGEIKSGLLASLGANVILNLPYQGSLMHRMVTVLACSAGMTACFAAGLMAHVVPMATLPLMLFVGFWVALFSRHYKLPPPGGVFIMMAAMIAMFLPSDLSQLAHQVGIIALGSMLAGVVACIYTLILLYLQPLEPAPVVGDTPDVLIDSMIVACVVTLSLAIALWLDMPRPYWTPMSCYVVIQGMTFKSMWVKQAHRVIGTAVGLLLAWGLFLLNLSPMGIAVMVLCLMFIIETLVMRNYVSAVVFITPLTIFLAEYSPTVPMDISQVMATRFWDTVLGCVVGILGAMVMLSPIIRQRLHRLQAWALQQFHHFREHQHTANKTQ